MAITPKDLFCDCYGDEYGMKANMVLEALMKFFNEGNCKIVVKKAV